jgi:hypothetical protein
MQVTNTPVHSQLQNMMNKTSVQVTTVIFKRCKANNYKQTIQHLQVQN